VIHFLKIILALLAPSAAAIVAVVSVPDGVLFAAGIVAAVLLARSLVDQEPEGRRAVRTTGGQLAGAVMLGLAVGALAGWVIRLGAPHSDLYPPELAVVAAALGVLMAAFVAPTTIGALVRRQPASSTSVAILGFGTGVLSGFGLAWGAISVLGSGRP